MFSVAFLAWLLGRLTKDLERTIGVVLEREAGFSVKAVSAELFPAVRAWAYVYWFAEAGFVRSVVGADAYIPSMPGVNPRLVEYFVRKELRLKNGQLVGNRRDIRRRLARSLSSVVAEVGRATVRAAMGENESAVLAAGRYAEQFGHPVVRLVLAQRYEPWWRIEFDRSRVLHETAGLVSDMWQADFGHTPGVDRVGVSEEKKRERQARRKLLRDEDKQFEERERQRQAEIDEEMRQARIEAEIFFGERDKHGRKPEDIVRSPSGGRFAEGWVRVPTGEWTCAFCLLLCARGPTYRSSSVTLTPGRVKKGLAPLIGAYGAPAYHANCDCIGVPVFGSRKYDGADAVAAAGKVYEAWTGSDEWFSGARPKHFASWLNSDAGREAVAKLVPDLGSNHVVSQLVEILNRKKKAAPYWWTV